MNVEYLCTLLQTLNPTGHFTKRSMMHKTTIEQLYSSFILMTLDLNQTIHFNLSSPLRDLQQQSTIYTNNMPPIMAIQFTSLKMTASC